MGIGGHILGPQKLRKLSRLTGLPLSRAYIRGGDSQGVVWVDDDVCEHYWIDLDSGEHELLGEEWGHWSSCAGRRRVDEAPPGS